jgi:hypothetical protein
LGVRVRHDVLVAGEAGLSTDEVVTAAASQE